jgi:phosphohistidine phosphatase
VKTLLVIRHAKAESAFTVNDFERALSERGKKDAQEIAARLKKRGVKIDAFISSPARRAKKTALLFCNILNKPEEGIIYISALYQATPETFYEVIENTNDQFSTIAIFSHNPSITYFVNSLKAGAIIDNMPTCAVFAAAANIISWKEFANAEKKFSFFDYPKKTE